MRILIVDDSRLGRVELKEQLSQIDGTEVVAEAGNIKDALAMLSDQNLTIDLLLLDIDLPDGTGFDLLEKLTVLPQVIFVTAFNEFAVKSFEYNAVDYLLKPVRFDRLQQSIAKVNAQHNPQKLGPDQRIFIKDRDACFFVSVDNIFAFEAMGNYTRVHIENAIPAIYKPISAIYKRLDTTMFFKASRSWVVNTNFINAIDAQENGTFSLTLKSGKEVLISKRQAIEFRRLWSL